MLDETCSISRIRARRRYDGKAQKISNLPVYTIFDKKRRRVKKETVTCLRCQRKFKSENKRIMRICPDCKENTDRLGIIAEFRYSSPGVEIPIHEIEPE